MSHIENEDSHGIGRATHPLLAAIQDRGVDHGGDDIRVSEAFLGGAGAARARRLRTSRLACASLVRSAKTSRSPVASSLGHPGEVHWSGA